MASMKSDVRAGFAAAAFFACLAASGSAQAACAGFDDVLQDGFCTNVTWIKNRQITVGCTPTTYCPYLSVSRLAMAAFMNRLGNVLTPAVVHAEESGASLDLLAGEHYLCQTDVLPSAPYLRLLTGEGALSFDVTGLQGLLLGVMMNRNEEGWVAIGGTAVLVDSGERHHAHVSVAPLNMLDPPQPGTYRFAISVGRRDPGLNAVGAWGCQLQVHAINGKL
jgi:hypothetical protein